MCCRLHLTHKEPWAFPWCGRSAHSRGVGIWATCLFRRSALHSPCGCSGANSWGKCVGPSGSLKCSQLGSPWCACAVLSPSVFLIRLISGPEVPSWLGRVCYLQLKQTPLPGIGSLPFPSFSLLWLWLSWGSPQAWLVARMVSSWFGYWLNQILSLYGQQDSWFLEAGNIWISWDFKACFSFHCF